MFSRPQSDIPVTTAPSNPPDQEEFETWFLGSRVVDDLGEPLVCYHGSESDAKTFRKRLTGGYAQLGFWFDAIPRLVESYALDHHRSSPSLIPAYLAIQNPKEYPSIENLRDVVEGKYGVSFISRMQKLRKDLIRAGFDGVVVRNGRNTSGMIPDYWVVFKSTQIRVTPGM
jgi:ADP-Ribosyltransferase in polyvalent proteins